jgi:glycosyltransferase involved in cell wall biosynthesis
MALDGKSIEKTIVESPKIAFLFNGLVRHLPPAVYAMEMIRESEVSVWIFQNDGQSEERIAIDDFDHSITIGTSAPNLKPKIFRTAMGILIFALKSASKLKKMKPMVIVTNDLVSQVIALFLYVFYKIPFTIHAHEISQFKDVSFLNLPFLFFEKFAFQKALFWVVPEINRQRIFTEWYGQKKEVYLVYNAPRLQPVSIPSNLRDKYGWSKNDIIVTYIGGLGDNVNIIQIIKSMALLPEHIKFVAVGWSAEQYLAEIRKTIDTLHLEKRVKIPGSIKGDQKWAHLSSCDIGICLYDTRTLGTSYSATSSNKVMEYMSQGLAIAVPDRPGYREIVEKFGCGSLTEEIEPTAIARALNTMTSSELTLMEMKNRARAAFESTFNFETQFRSALEAYKRLSK